jgi:hypothetical protein
LHFTRQGLAVVGKSDAAHFVAKSATLVASKLAIPKAEKYDGNVFIPFRQERCAVSDEKAGYGAAA